MATIRDPKLWRSKLLLKPLPETKAGDPKKISGLVGGDVFWQPGRRAAQARDERLWTRRSPPSAACSDRPGESLDPGRHCLPDRFLFIVSKRAFLGRPELCPAGHGAGLCPGDHSG